MPYFVAYLPIIGILLEIFCELSEYHISAFSSQFFVTKPNNGSNLVLYRSLLKKFILTYCVWWYDKLSKESNFNENLCKIWEEILQ